MSAERCRKSYALFYCSAKSLLFNKVMQNRNAKFFIIDENHAYLSIEKAECKSGNKRSENS
jgi:hypothetical protein